MSYAATAYLQHEAFAQAKARLSDLMDQAVHAHRPQLIDRHRGKEQAVLVSVEDLTMLLEGFSFHPRVSVSAGEFIVRLPELGLVAGGASYEDALEELVELVDSQAEDFLARLDFYMQTDRRSQLAYLLKFALTDPEERRSLFSPAAPPEETRAVQSA
jgi:prevent-host-death family protein